MAGEGEESDIGQLWVIDEEGNLGIAMVRKGATDGVKTAITQLERPERRGSLELGEQMAPFPPRPRLEIEEGMQVISGVNKQEEETTRERSGGALFGRRMGPP
jgi:hypothetical protein